MKFRVTRAEEGRDLFELFKETHFDTSDRNTLELSFLDYEVDVIQYAINGFEIPFYEQATEDFICDLVSCIHVCDKINIVDIGEHVTINIYKNNICLLIRTDNVDANRLMGKVRALQANENK